MREWGIAGLSGAAGVALWRQAKFGRWTSIVVPFDVFAFAVFAYQRNDYLALWRLVGPWGRRFPVQCDRRGDRLRRLCRRDAGRVAQPHRALRPVEAIGLIAIPFMFNLLVVSARIGTWRKSAARSRRAIALPFPAQVFLGRTLVLFVIAERGLAILLHDRPQPAAARGQNAGAAVRPAALAARRR